jgi:YihY family inner membrane protein
MGVAELATAHIARELAREHEPLIRRELARELGYATQLVARQCEPLDVGTRVGNLNFAAFAAGKRERGGDRRLDWAASAERAATIVNPREKPLLERVGDVGATGELTCSRCAGQQLKCGLAIAVFQVLPHEAVTVRREQQPTSRARDERDHFTGIEPTEPGGPTDARRARDKSLGALLSGGHESMSVQVTRTPPSRFVRAWLRAFDRYQQRSSRLGFLVAVFKRFDEDQASQMGALIAYYGFFSLFPLLLVFVTALGFLLEGSPSTQASVLHSTLSQFPIIGTQLQSNVHSLRGSVPALAIGLVGSMLAGLGITGATQSAFNKVWGVPRRRQLGFLAWRLHGLWLLVVFGLLSIVSTVAAGYVTAQTTGVIGAIGGVLVALAANLLLFFAVFRLLTSEEVDTHDLLPGVVVAAILWQILQHVGGLYVDHVVRHAKETSGLFAFVLGLLSWLYLGGQVTLIAAEVNVVRARRLWPRRLFLGA